MLDPNGIAISTATGGPSQRRSSLWPTPTLPGRSLLELAALRVVARDLAFEQPVRKAIDSARWPKTTKTQVEKKLAAFDSQIREREVELDRRGAQAQG